MLNPAVTVLQFKLGCLWDEPEYGLSHDWIEPDRVEPDWDEFGCIEPP